MESSGMNPLVWVVLAAVAAVAVYFVMRRRRGAATPPRKTLNATVAGVTAEDEHGWSPQQTIVNLQSGDRLKLVVSELEGRPAIAVQDQRGGGVGWLQDSVGGEVRTALEAGERVDCRVADITGGTRGNPNLGVTVELKIY